MRVLFYDTETSGLPKSYNPAEQDVNNYPYCLQLGATIIDLNLNTGEKTVIFRKKLNIKPTRNGKQITIHPKAEEAHKLSVEQLTHIGVDISEAVYIFMGLVNSVDLIATHNYTLNRNVMASELMRLGIRPMIRKGTKILCTMKYTAPILNLRRKSNNIKFPILGETYYHFLKENMNKKYIPHDTLENIGATIDIFMHLVNYDSKFLEILKSNEPFTYK